MFYSEATSGDLAVPCRKSVPCRLIRDRRPTGSGSRLPTTAVTLRPTVSRKHLKPRGPGAERQNFNGLASDEVFATHRRPSLDALDACGLSIRVKFNPKPK